MSNHAEDQGRDQPFPLSVARAMSGSLRIWRGTLEICFLLLCLRFVWTSFWEVSTDIWPTLILVASGAGLGVFRPQAASYAFTAAAIPILGFTSLTVLPPTALSLYFSALWIGLLAQRLIFTAPSKNPLRPGPLGSMVVMVDLLITAHLLSLGAELWQHHTEPEFPLIANRQAALGFGSPHYFLTSAFVWLQGLFYFREMLGGETGRKDESANITKWFGSVMALWVSSVVLFWGLQRFFKLPDPLHNFVYFAPLEDISSFGSIVVAGLISVIASLRLSAGAHGWVRIIAIPPLSLLVVASWSRGTWLAGIIFLFLIAAFRFRKRYLALFSILFIASVIAANLNSDKLTTGSTPYLARFIGLVKWGEMAGRDSGRMNLYHKAIGMISARPWTGHGIGSFYLSSPSYAKPDDPGASTPDFAHNVFLQVAAELGIPVAALFATLIFAVFWRGCRGAKIFSRRRIDQITARPDEIDRRLTLFGALMALGAYLLTQMTANSLNVYPSNQFFFWFLMAAILAYAAKQKETVPATPAAG